MTVREFLRSLDGVDLDRQIYFRIANEDKKDDPNADYLAIGSPDWVSAHCKSGYQVDGKDQETLIVEMDLQDPS